MLYLSLCISSHFFLGERMLFLFLSFFFCAGVASFAYQIPSYSVEYEINYSAPSTGFILPSLVSSWMLCPKPISFLSI